MRGGGYAVGEEVSSGDEQRNIFEHDISIERLLTKRTPSSGKRLRLQVLLNSRQLRPDISGWHAVNKTLHVSAYRCISPAANRCLQVRMSSVCASATRGAGDNAGEIAIRSGTYCRHATQTSPGTDRRPNVEGEQTTGAELQENCHNWEKPSGSNTDAL